MSFIKKIKKNGKTYLAEVESKRVNGKVIHKYIRYIGKESDGKTILSTSISEAAIESVRLSGPLMVLHSIAESIGLGEILGEYSNEILSMVYAHCLDYQSLTHLRRWYNKTDLNLLLSLDKLTEKRLVNALDALESEAFAEKQKIIFSRVKKTLEIKTKGIVYDVTNTYFHGKKCAKAKYGHDKEKRKGNKLIQIGLAVTQELGIPIYHKTFPGNIHDARTFSDVSNDLAEFGITSGVAVIDRGITSAENTAFMSKNMWKVLCGIKIDNNIRKHLGTDFNPQLLCVSKNRLRMGSTIFYYKSQKFVHGGVSGRLISIFNARKSVEITESRQDEIAAAKIRLDKGKSIKPELEKFFNQTGSVNEKQIAIEKIYDGMSFLFTTTNYSDPDAIVAYFDKDVVEKCFQSLKGVVNLRPIRHWLYNRVEAHVFICYLSCLLLSILKEKVKPLGLSFQAALNELDGLYRIYLRDPKNNFKIDRLVALTKKQEEILKMVDKTLLRKCSQ
ncbi:transposase [Bdellovibrionota bacterium FG-1]